MGGFGKFFYHNGATYEGEWKLLFAEPPAPPEDPKDAKKKKGKDEPPPPPTVPPKRVRHGKGGPAAAWRTYTNGAPCLPCMHLPLPAHGARTLVMAMHACMCDLCMHRSFTI